MAVDTLELLESYPDITESMITWFTKKMFRSFEDESVPENIKDYMKLRGVTKEQLSTLIDINPRMLLDFFDENKVYIEIQLSMDNPPNFGYMVNRNKYDEFLYNSRYSAEMQATSTAFEILNNELNKKKDESSNNKDV
jgi:hypothetical protein